MATCNDCLYFIVCEALEQGNGIKKVHPIQCGCFKDKANFVEVVRCKDCEHCCISTDPKTNISIQKCGYVGFNPIQSSQVSDDFYCGYGELKEREGK